MVLHEFDHLQGKEHVNYFTCTLGQAAATRAEHPTSYDTVNDLFDERFKKIPHRPAVGFPEAVKNKGTWTYQVFSECTSSTLCGFQLSTVRTKIAYEPGWQYRKCPYKLALLSCSFLCLFPMHIPPTAHIPSNTETSLQRPTANINLSSKERVSGVVPSKGECCSAMSKLRRLSFDMAWPHEKWALSPADRVCISAESQPFDRVAVD